MHRPKHIQFKSIGSGDIYSGGYLAGWCLQWWISCRGYVFVYLYVGVYNPISSKKWWDGIMAPFCWKTVDLWKLKLLQAYHKLIHNHDYVHNFLYVRTSLWGLHIKMVIIIHNETRKKLPFLQCSNRWLGHEVGVAVQASLDSLCCRLLIPVISFWSAEMVCKQQQWSRMCAVW